RPYSAGDLAGKRECKLDLMREMGLEPRLASRPLIGIVSRFAAQKGFDLLTGSGEELAREQATLVALGSGEPRYEQIFRRLAESHPENVRVRIGYDNPLAHRIEAGADLFLMPSRYEPCGLSQIYSLRYGTIPVVRATGGLDGTITEATGFKFSEYSGPALLGAVREALAAFARRDKWTARMKRAMREDFSWGVSAAAYSALYRRLRME
ncbi:MAG: glycogen synthase, partial [Bryobacteraceae bacterium]